MQVSLLCPDLYKPVHYGQLETTCKFPDHQGVLIFSLYHYEVYSFLAGFPVAEKHKAPFGPITIA